MQKKPEGFQTFVRFCKIQTGFRFCKIQTGFRETVSYSKNGISQKYITKIVSSSSP